jgi:tetratricopeptide (TPR) repeat protein
MSRLALGDRGLAFFGPLAAGFLALLAAYALLPSGGEITAATRRAIGFLPQVAASAILPAFSPAPAVTTEMLAERLSKGGALSEAELRQLLEVSSATADASMLSAIAKRLGARFPDSTAQISWLLLAKKRPAVARSFFELQPDRSSPSLWRLRFEVHRKADDDVFAAALVRDAAVRPGTAPPKDLIEAAYSLNIVETLLIAAEHRAIPPLERTMSRDLAQRAVRSGRFDLIPRIDRVGDANWRYDDPWLAFNLARRSGDTAAALRYAELLPSGRLEARDAVIMASGDRNAIRGLLLSNAKANRSDIPKVTEQLVQLGFRPEAMALLRAESAERAPDDPLVQRLLYLMGPRPDPENLGWLRERAAPSSQWEPIYLDRERPAAALAFLESRSQAPDTDALILRLKLANAARDRQSATRTVSKLLDGRRLSPGQLSVISSQMPSGASGRLTLALANARLAAGGSLASDRLDLAWDAWNRGDTQEAANHLQGYLKIKPGDASALRLMADIEAKRAGPKASRPWLERALARTAALSTERVQILGQLGRKREALDLIDILRRETPNDRRLSVIHARLLIENGNPGRALKVLQR